MEPIKFEFNGKQCRLYHSGDIIDKPTMNDIVKDENGNYFVYLASIRGQNFLNILLDNHEPIKLAVKTTVKEQEEKYNVFESKLKL